MVAMEPHFQLIWRFVTFQAVMVKWDPKNAFEYVPRILEVTNGHYDDK